MIIFNRLNHLVVSMKGILGQDRQYLVSKDKMRRVEYDLGFHKTEVATDCLIQRQD